MEKLLPAWNAFIYVCGRLVKSGRDSNSVRHFPLKVEPAAISLDGESQEMFVHFRISCVEVTYCTPPIFAVGKPDSAFQQFSPLEGRNWQSFERSHGSVVGLVVNGELPHWMFLQVRNLE
jgi:hypothetical protein